MDITLVDTIREIPAAEWDALGGPSQPRPRDPFTTHRFLLALEQSGSVGPGTGWEAKHLLIRQDGRLLAAMPLYAKSHSQGEYIFDHAFADAWHRAGGRYYPKLQSAVPFTPATGPRLLGPEELQPILLRALAEVTRSNDLSSAHVTFCTAEEAALGVEEGFLHRVTQQFHWQDDGYGDFDGFLGALSSRKRKTIRRERAQAQGFGGTIHALTGADLQPDHWDAFWHFYQDTGSRKWGSPYLTRAFFDLVHDSMAEDILLVLAEREGRWVAGALNFIGADTLFGRYWGCVEDHPCLHFELCYYQAIDWALANGLSRVEAGAQGEHKLARGYLPAEVHSLHFFPDTRFQSAVEDYLRAETAAVGDEMRYLEAYAPFRRGALEQGRPAGAQEEESE
ncbi:GNAT family N-acetyltransferase [Pararhodobacter sp. CCB-MM2]|uniref:GNAT family N-acetyltransferase n=1 Tax=Pararhodobacter sp. CCB-MM2 TaxID=1786003 RepID=UPI000B12021E|nr:GNAT family N-acetyltransferase [Pararhodobacter sp. CCB-MM2]